MGKPQSVLLITVDCLRADHVGFPGYGRPTTPFLNSIAQQAYVFRSAIAAGTPTYYSFPAIHASRYPTALGRDIIGIAPEEPTLATALQGAGYTTGAFLAANPYLSPHFGYAQGFQTFQDFLNPADGKTARPESRQAPGRVSSLRRFVEQSSQQTRLTSAAYGELHFWYCQWHNARETRTMDQLRCYPAADVIVDEATAWLRALTKEPFFLWLHLMDPHHPFYPPEAALAATGAGEISAPRARFLNSMWNRDVGPARVQRYLREVLSLYDASIYWVDQQISRLVHSLQELQRWDETLMLVTADHGEQFLEHGARYHSPMGLPEQLIHVPLLLRSPEFLTSKVLDGPFSLIDLAPTILESVGVETPRNFRGHSCWKQVKAGNLPDEPVITECVEACNNPFRREERMRSRLIAARDRSYKLVVNFREQKDYFYDLSNDPEESAPLRPEVLSSERARLLHAVRSHLQQIKTNDESDTRLRACLREFQQLDSAGLSSSVASTAS